MCLLLLRYVIKWKICLWNTEEVSHGKNSNFTDYTYSVCNISHSTNLVKKMLVSISISCC